MGKFFNFVKFLLKHFFIYENYATLTAFLNVKKVMIKNFGKIKIYLIVFFSLSLNSLSNAGSEKNDGSKKKIPNQSCEAQFIKIVHPNELLNLLIMRLEKGSLYPVLLKELYQFRDRLDLLPAESMSLSDASLLERHLYGLVLPFVFWDSSRSNKVFHSIGNFERGLGDALKGWGESSLGRSLNEREVQALERAYNYDVENEFMIEVRYFTKQKILKEAGFSEKEIEHLGWKKVLGGKKSIVLETHQNTRQEDRLRAQGYAPDFIKGMDEIEELTTVAKQLKRENIDPYKSIPYFGRKLREDMTYMSAGAVTSEQREHFKHLKQYMEILIREQGGITYEQLLTISLRMTDILSEEINSYPSVIQLLVHEFSKGNIYMPTTVGKIGYMPLHSMRNERIEPIGLINMVDGQLISPLTFAMRDVLHSFRNDTMDKDFYDKWMEIRKNLPVAQVQNVELVYHVLTRKIITIDVDFFTDIFTEHPEYVKDKIRVELSSQWSEENIRDNDLLDRQVQVVSNDFIQIYNEIRRGGIPN